MDDVTGLIDLATAPDPAPAPTEEAVTTPSAPDQTLDTHDVPSDDTTVESEDQASPDGVDAEKPVDGRTNPAAVRAALKALRDSDPKMAPIARQLNDAFGRYNAYKSVFPKVADAQNARALLDAVGGDEGLTALQERTKSFAATDQKLYAGDPSVLDDILEDMKSEGKIDAFGKLASPFLEKLRATDEKAYFAAMKPHFFQGLRDVGFQNVLQGIIENLSGETPNVNNAKAIASQMANWYEDLKASVDSASKQNLDPERQAFEQERTKFQTERQKEFQTSVANECDSHNNKALGSALKSYLSMPFFKGWSRESLVDLGAGLKQQLFSELGSDKTYQAQMDAFFSQKSPDKGKITAYHTAKVDTMAKRIVKDLLNRRYPGFAKAQRTVGKAPAKPVAASQGAQRGADGKFQFQYVTSKPEWNDIDFEEPGAHNAYVTGRAKLKTGRYVSWNLKDKR
jgi:hypothetical protein